jgi:predicted Zn-dependent protease
MGQPAAAESVLVAALAYYPTSSRLLRKLAEARAAAGDIPGALNAAEQAVRHGYLDIDSDRAYLDALRARHPEADSSPRIIPTPQP